MKIYDCFPYSGLENDLLELRFEVLDEFVDYFVIVEADYDFADNYKGFQFKNNKKFEHKIRYFQVKEQDVDWQKLPTWSEKHSSGRKREYNLREQIKQGLHDADVDDIILLCDVDEIPIIENLDYEKDLFIFKQLCFQGKLNLLNPAYTPWDKHPKGIKHGKLGNCQELRMHLNYHKNLGNYDTLSSQLVDPGGWHFSYVLPETGIYKKIQSFINYRPENKLTVDQIREKLNNQQDLFDGRYNYNNPTTDLKKVGFDVLPKYIKDNANKFKHLLL